MTETEKQDGMTESGIVESEMADETCDMDDLMAELSEDELAELAELEELEELAEIANLEELEEIEFLAKLDDLDEFEEMWLEEDEENGDEGTLQEGIPTSDGLTDSPDDGQGETSRTEETEQADEAEDPYDQIVDGYIYLITNLVNGKKYVGQTTKTIEERWRQHVFAANIIQQKKYTSIMDMAIAKYGQENFSYQEIEHLIGVTRRYLDQRECYWIAEYRTCIKDYGKDCGYNLTHGGHSCLNRFSLDEELEIVHEIQDLHWARKTVAQYHNTSTEVIRMILQKHGIEAMTTEEVNQYLRHRLGNGIQQLDSNGNILRTFSSSYEAADWLQAHDDSLIYHVRRGIASTIRKAAYQCQVCYGYYWHVPSLSEEAHTQRAQVLKNGKKRDESYYARKGEPDNVCPVCGKRIGRKASFCQKHARDALQARMQEERKKKGTPKLNGIPITQEELIELLRFHTVEGVAQQYGVSGNWLKKFAKINFAMDIKRTKLFRLWNAEYESYEFFEHLPFTIGDLKQFLLAGGTFKEFAQSWRISFETLRKYIQQDFGIDTKELRRQMYQ